MKTVAVLLAALLATAHANRCVAHCRTRLLQSSEGDCARWREELPRPDLYNHCQQGYTEGREASCHEFCSGKADERRLDSRRLDACSDLRARPPAERGSACNEGYVLARSRARELSQDRRLFEEEEPAAKIEVADTARKLSSKGSPKSLLEAAREEAAAAFHEAKSADL